MNITQIAEAIAERRIELLRGAPAVADKEFETLSRALNVLSPRVTADMVEQLQRDVEAVQAICAKADKYADVGIINDYVKARAEHRKQLLVGLREQVGKLADNLPGTQEDDDMVHKFVMSQVPTGPARPITRKGKT